MNSTIKKIVCLNSLIFAFCAGTAHAAKLDGVTTASPAQILIEHALIKTSGGNKQAVIRLIAKDKQNLHDNQVYQAQIESIGSTASQDGSYDEADETIFIPKLMQNGGVTYQITLRLINPKTLEFAVIENTVLSSESEVNQFFDSKSVHNVNYYFSDN